MKFNARLLIFTLILIAATTYCKFQFGPDLNWSGFSPIIAISLFSGMLINDRSKTFLFPLLSLFASDVVIEILYRMDLFAYSGFYTYQLFNYALLLAVTFLGWKLKGKSYGQVGLGAIAAPTVFFIISNMGAFIIDTGNLYSNDFSGLMLCYKAGIPFYKNALMATLLFLPAIVLTYNIIVKRTTAVKLA